MSQTDWAIIETEFDPAHLHHQETVFTLGNGYLGTRGTFEEEYPGAWPATLIHGVYDDVPIFYTELANCPNWLPLVVFVAGEPFRMDRGEVLQYQRRLDLHRGVLSRDVRWRSRAGHTVDLRFERFASLADPHVLAVRCEITPVDFEGWVEIQAGINGYPDNWGVMHWHILDQGDDIFRVWLHSRTRHSGLELGMAASLLLQGGRQTSQHATGCDGVPTLVAQCKARRGRTITATKLVSVYTSRDLPTPSPPAPQPSSHPAIQP
ncbi:MAG: beta-phosphoglucomutase, partial [Anaerolineae bacterium]